LSVRRAARYAQVSTSVRAMKSRMLGKNGYDRLLRSSSASECLSILREEEYFETTMGTGEALDPASWQRLLDPKMINLIHKLSRLSPDGCAQLLAEFENLYRLESLKLGLRLIASPEAKEATPEITLPAEGEESLHGIVETRNLEQLVQSAGAHALSSEISSALGENKPLPLIEAIIDKYTLARIWKTAETLDWIDRQSVRSLIGEHIDATNLLVVARSKALGIPSEGVEQATVPVNYRLGDTLSEAKSSGSATGALRAFMKTAYANPVGEFLDTHKEGNSLHQLDVLLRREHASSCLAAFSGFPFQAGLPVAFVYLIGYEASDLRGMISGKQEALSVERIQQLLIL